MNDWKSKIKEDTNRQKLNTNIGWFLNKSVQFDSSLYLNSENGILADQLYNSLDLQYGYKQEQKRKDFNILLANLLYQTRKPIQISMSKNSWKQNQYNQVSFFITELIHLLAKKALVTMNIGIHNIPNQPNRETRISATKRLLDFFPEYKNGILYEPFQLVILRDGNGKLKEFKDTKETVRIRTVLQRMNDVNSRADIRYSRYKLNGFLTAIFVERFTLYGRLHTKGFRHYQGLSGEERKEITINGDSIVELDYSGLHPNLLYAAEGIQYSVDPYSALDPRPQARPFLKHILLCMINSKNLITAEKAANNWLYLNHSERKELKKIGISRARPLIDRFFEEHKQIAHYFCQGKETGLKIMNLDSKIALDVVNHFAINNLPILAVHDSFIVQIQHQDELLQTMLSVYQKHTGLKITVK